MFHHNCLHVYYDLCWLPSRKPRKKPLERRLLTTSKAKSCSSTANVKSIIVNYMALTIENYLPSFILPRS